MEPKICPIDSTKLKEITENHYKCNNGHFFRFAIEATVVLVKLDSNGNDTDEKYEISTDNSN